MAAQGLSCSIFLRSERQKLRGIELSVSKRYPFCLGFERSQLHMFEDS